MEGFEGWDLPEIDPERCNGCGVCVVRCPTQALAMMGRLAYINRPENCLFSSMCEEICPQGAIRLPYYLDFHFENP